MKFTEAQLEQLQTFLNQNEIPKIKNKPKTFLGIAKQPHYENVLSNIYAFYFNVNEEHHLKNLFISSFQQLINESELGKQKAIDLGADFDIDTEYGTNDNGRIDILLHNKEQAIIVENKVYHHLANDLDDYWETVEAINKIGVILSLHNVSKDNYSKYKNADNYMNITHLNLLERVMKNSGSFLLEANDKYIVFLKDLYQNIKNLSKSNMKEKDLKFYFDNQKKINDIKVFHRDVHNFVKREVIKAGDALNDLNLFAPRGENQEQLRYYVCPTNKNLMITVVFDELMTDKKELHIIVKMINDLLVDKKQYDKIVFTESEKYILNKDFTENTNKYWAHFATEHYKIEDIDMNNLSLFIQDRLSDKSPLRTIFNKLKDSISVKK